MDVFDAAPVRARFAADRRTISRGGRTGTSGQGCITVEAVRFGLLGSLAVWATDGTTVRIRERKVRALLADLLVQEGRPVSAGRLAEDLWGGALPGNPANTLQTKVSQLRRALEAVEAGSGNLVVYQPAGYALHVDADAVDAHRFCDLVKLAHETEDRQARVEQLDEALRLWRGPALADFGEEEFARAAIARLEEQRLTALEARAEARLELGQHSLLTDELGSLVAQHPLRERLRAAHMLALYRAGQQGAALASYRELRDELGDELGLDPGPDLAALHVAILKHDPALAPPPVRPPRSSSQPRTNLPAPLTGLVGRTQAMSEVRHSLSSARLVTLVGPGGVGKSRLAVETASQVVDSFGDGVWLVELAGLGPEGEGEGSGAVAEAVMRVLGIREGSSHAPDWAGRGAPLELLARALRTERLLLVLDNCEPLVASVAELGGALLPAAPGLRILATSQEPLGVPGEVVCPIPPLDEASAVELFVERARAAAPGFTLAAEDAGTVATLCRRLDGIPLALELAATRVRALGVHGLVDGLRDRFRLLEAGRNGGPPRQQTLRAAIDWSWELLSTPEQMVLRRLAVHAGSFDRQAAESICIGEAVRAEDVLPVLGRLVDRSLLAVVHGSRGPRYHLLESVAHYCRERLYEARESDRFGQRHDGYYVELAELAVPHLRGHAQQEWLDRLDGETANLRRALEGTVQRGQRDRALRLVNAMAWYWFLRGRLREACRSLELALNTDGQANAGVEAVARTWQTGMSVLAGQLVRRLPGGTEALEMCMRIGDARDRARAEWFLGFVECDLGDLSISEELVRRALATAQAAGDCWGIATALSTRAKQAMLRGDFAEVERSGEGSLEMFRQLGDRWGQLQSTEWLGALARVRGDYEAACHLHEIGLRMAEELGLWPQAADHLSWLGRIAMHLPDAGQPRDLHQRALALAARQSYLPGETFAEIGLGMAARREGDLATAETHLRRVLDRGRRSAVEQGMAVTLLELGFVAEERGDAAAAQALHLDGLAACRKVGDPRGVALALEGVAGAQGLAGHHGAAALLLGAADAARLSTGAPLPAAERGDVERITARARAALGNQDFASEFALGATLDPDDALGWIGPVLHGRQTRPGTPPRR